MHVSDAQSSEVAVSAGAKRPRGSRERVVGSPTLPAIVVTVLTALGAAVRIAVADQSVFGDELATYWIVSTNDLAGVVETVHGDAEITPPLYFVLAWAATQIDFTPELLRAPSLVAGTAAIPLIYLVGIRTVGRGAAVVAATLTALAPFMIFYSAEARGYQLAVVLVLLSTLALLTAVDGGRARLWIAYGACSCAAVYTHYTVVFALGAQLLWVMWAHPEAHRAALLANAAAVVAFLPWLGGLTADLSSPTTDILSSLSPFDLRSVRISIQHWSIGYPFAFESTRLRELPGMAAVVMFGLGLAVAVAGLAFAWLRVAPRTWLVRIDRRLVLVLALTLATPVGEAVVTAVSTNLFGTRNLAVSWPWFALSVAALIVAAGPRLRFVAAALVIGSFAIGAVKMLDEGFARPDFEAAAALVDREAVRGDVVVDGAVGGLTPGPLSSLDVGLDRPHRVFRVGAPQQRDHPFAVLDPIFPVADVMRRVAKAASGRRIFIVTGDSPVPPSPAARIPNAEQIVEALPPRYRRTEARTYPGILRLVVLVYADRGLPRE
jgi:hypothetical protein